MALFGESFPALQDPNITATAGIVSTQTLISGSTSLLTFQNTHEFEVGMMIDLRNFAPEIDDYRDYVYILAETSLTVTIDLDVGNNTLLVPHTVEAYIGLDYATFEAPIYKEIQKIERVSILTGYRNAVRKGYYTDFTIKLNLLSMPSPQRANLAKLLENIDGGDYIFYPHIDRAAIRDDSLSTVLFNVENTYEYISPIDFRDVSFVNLKSKEYTNIKNNIG